MSNIKNIISRSDFFKRLFLIGLSGTSIPTLFASAPKKDDEPANETASLTALTKPYLQFPAPDAMTVMWVTNKQCLSWIEFSKSGTAETTEAVSENFGLKAYNKIHKIRLRNLEPGTEYSYRVCYKELVSIIPITFGEAIRSDEYSFKTQGISDNEVSVLIMNDIHDRPETIPHLLGLNKEPYDFVCLNGDIMNHISSESQIINHVINPCTESFASNKPFVYIRGNHETRGLFARNLYDYLDTGEMPYYAFSRGPAFFVVMDSGEDKTDDHKEYFGLVCFDKYRERQAVWLEQQLKSEAAKKAKFRIALMHIPHYHSGDWHGTMHCRELFSPIFNKYKIDIFIAGHTHRYGIFEPSKDEHNFPVIIGGGPADGKRTLIKLNVTDKNLYVKMIKDSGEIVGEYKI
ncbi:MAG: metallophosphoesterase family protein [Prevotellaceae bacterium]|jgi:predicted phosphodiesterase|nr:metallophosphoesterase family protein [Prevotellaceae bacterium]